MVGDMRPEGKFPDSLISSTEYTAESLLTLLKFSATLQSKNNCAFRPARFQAKRLIWGIKILFDRILFHSRRGHYHFDYDNSIALPVLYSFEFNQQE